MPLSLDSTVGTNSWEGEKLIKELVRARHHNPRSPNPERGGQLLVTFETKINPCLTHQSSLVSKLHTTDVITDNAIAVTKPLIYLHFMLIKDLIFTLLLLKTRGG